MAPGMASVIRCGAIERVGVNMKAVCGAAVRAERPRHSAGGQKIQLPAPTEEEKRVVLAQPLFLPENEREERGNIRKFLPFEIEVGTYSPDFERDIEKNREALETALRCSIGLGIRESEIENISRRDLARDGDERGQTNMEAKTRRRRVRTKALETPANSSARKVSGSLVPLSSRTQCRRKRSRENLQRAYAAAAVVKTAAEKAEELFMEHGVFGAGQTQARRLLSPDQEKTLGAHVNLYVRLRLRREALAEDLGRQPTLFEVARDANMKVVSYKRAIRNGQAARERMVVANLRLVTSVVKAYSSPGITFSDLVQEGVCGLIKAVERFDPKKGYRFSTYAHWWIRQSVMRSIADKARLVRIPVHVLEKLAKVKRQEKSLETKLGRKPTVQEIADKVSLSPEKVEWLGEVTGRPVSLENSCGHGTEKIGDTIFAEDSGAQELVEDFLRSDIRRVISSLAPKEQRVLILRYGLDSGKKKTLRECAEIFGVTKERVRQVEMRAIRKLKDPSRSDALVDYVL